MTVIIDWLLQLDPVFAFMLALPFAVAFAGLTVEFCRRSRRRSPSAGASTLRRTSMSHGLRVWP